MANKDKAVIFDLFGVISSGVAQSWFDRHFPEESAKALKTEWCARIDIGDLSGSKVWKELGKLAGMKPADVEGEWLELAKIRHEVVDAIRELKKKKYRIALCSDAGWLFVRKLLKDHDIARLFDATVISSEVGVVKPDPEIFKHTLRKLRISAKKAVFVDDTEENVRAAELLGMRGILFKSVADLAEL